MPKMHRESILGTQKESILIARQKDKHPNTERKPYYKRQNAFFCKSTCIARYSAGFVGWGQSIVMVHYEEH